MEAIIVNQPVALDFYQLQDMEIDLTERVTEARENMEAAWSAANKTTVDEGYTYAQWQAAAEQARLAEMTYMNLWYQLDAVKAAMLDAVEDCEIDCTPMGGWESFRAFILD